VGGPVSVDAVFILVSSLTLVPNANNNHVPI